MIQAVNDLSIKDTNSYSGNGTFIPDLPIEQLSIHVFTNDVIMQVTESPQQPPAFSDSQDTECHLYKGFTNLEPLVPWTAIRFRAPYGGPAVVTFRAYNSKVVG